MIEGEELVLPIEPREQHDIYSCGLEMVALLLKATGREDLVNDGLRNKLGVDSEIGTPPDNIKKLFSEEGIEFEESSGADLEEMKCKLREAKLCLVAYQAWGDEDEYRRLEGGHYSVVIGMSETRILLADPSVHEDVGFGRGVRYIEKEEFLRNWVDVDYRGELYLRWYLAVPIAENL